MLIEALGLEGARLVALCGAGGKTSLMFALAREMAANGERVLVTTTTKMAAEEGDGPWPPGVSLSHGGTAGGKLQGHPPEAIDAVAASGQYDRVLVEADGSRRRPLKAPAAHEPVIPSSTDAVVVVAGMSGLGRPLSEETVFRAEIWAALSGTTLGASVDAEAFARIALHEAGLAKGCPPSSRATLFLNQVDTPPAHAAAASIARLLVAAAHRPFARIVAGRLQPSPELSLVVSV